MSTKRANIGLRLLAGLATALLVSGAMVVPALAAAPNVNTGSGITVDGDLSEWTEADFFADMYRAGKSDKEVESHLFLRYDCDAGILYVGVVAAEGVTIIESDGDNFVKFGQSDKKVDGSDSPADGTQPDFEYAPEGAGWEASFAIGEVSISDLNVHAQVEHDGSQTSAVADRAIPMTITCAPGEEDQEVTAAAASVTAPTCDAVGALNVPADTDSIDYEVSPAYAAGMTGTFTVTATAKEGFTLTGPSEWTLTVEAQLSGDDCEGTLGGNPTPAPAQGGGEVPDTAMGDVAQLPVTWISLAFIAAVALLFVARLAHRR